MNKQKLRRERKRAINNIISKQREKEKEKDGKKKEEEHSTHSSKDESYQLTKKPIQ